MEIITIIRHKYLMEVGMNAIINAIHFEYAIL